MNTTTETPTACHAAAELGPQQSHEHAAAATLAVVVELIATHPEVPADRSELIARALGEIARDWHELHRADRATDAARDHLATMALEFHERAHTERMRADESYRVAANATARRDSDTTRAQHLRHAADHDREMTGAIGRREAYRDALRVLNID